MGKMLGMRELDYKNQIAVRSIATVKEAFDELVRRAKYRTRLRYFGRKLTNEAFANAVWLWLSDEESMPIADLERHLTPYVARWEEMVRTTVQEEDLELKNEAVVGSVTPAKPQQDLTNEAKIQEPCPPQSSPAAKKRKGAS